MGPTCRKSDYEPQILLKSTTIISLNIDFEARFHTVRIDIYGCGLLCMERDLGGESAGQAFHGRFFVNLKDNFTKFGEVVQKRMY